MRSEVVLMLVALGLYYIYRQSQQPQVMTTRQNQSTNAYGINTTQSVTQNGVQVFPQTGGGSSCIVGNTAYYSSTSVCPPPGVGK